MNRMKNGFEGYILEKRMFQFYFSRNVMMHLPVQIERLILNTSLCVMSYVRSMGQDSLAGLGWFSTVVASGPTCVVSHQVTSQCFKLGNIVLINNTFMYC